MSDIIIFFIDKGEPRPISPLMVEYGFSCHESIPKNAEKIWIYGPGIQPLKPEFDYRQKQ